MFSHKDPRYLCVLLNIPCQGLKHNFDEILVDYACNFVKVYIPSDCIAVWQSFDLAATDCP